MTNLRAALATAAVASLVLAGLFIWWFQPSWPIALAYVVFSLIALLAVPLSYRWFGYHDYDVITDLHAREQREHDEMLDRLQRLERDLGSLGNKRGEGQAQSLVDLLNDFHEVIENRFPGKQLSASSYLGAARRVQNQAIQNLSDMVGVGHSLASLQRQHSTDTDTMRTQEQRITQLIDDNERLFQALVDTSVEVANIQEIGEFERTETLARLKDLSIIARQQGT
jgi:hypothetical protein